MSRSNFAICYPLQLKSSKNVRVGGFTWWCCTVRLRDVIINCVSPDISCVFVRRVGSERRRMRGIFARSQPIQRFRKWYLGYKQFISIRVELCFNIWEYSSLKREDRQRIGQPTFTPRVYCLALPTPEPAHHIFSFVPVGHEVCVYQACSSYSLEQDTE